MEKHYREENDCLNCGTILEGRFCHNCGQENLQLKESFGHMMNHAISDYFHFDQKFFHTLKPLFLKPGFLSNEYMAGRRAQYLHPVKMYIFISIVYFLLLFQTGYDPVKVNHTNTNADDKKETASANKELDDVAKNPNIPIYAKKGALLGKNETAKAAAADTSNGYNNSFIPPITNDTTYRQYTASQQKLPEDKRDGFFKTLYNKKAFTYKERYGPMAREVFADEFKHNIPKMMFLMLPLCALILSVAFRKNKKYYVEHLIYTFHLHCFLFLFLAVIFLLQMILPISQGINALIGLTATVAIIWYIYKSLRTVYHRSAWRTISKIIGASFMYLAVFMFCLLLVFFITALTAA